VYWLQDLYSVAMTRALEARRVPFGQLIGRCLQLVEGALLRSAQEVVVITEDFLSTLSEWGVDIGRCTVIENWAPIEELPERHRENEWRVTLGLGAAFVFLYSGTLGLKHDPDLLYALAEQVEDQGAHVVVVSEGLGIERLRSRQSLKPLSNLQLLPFQPYSQLPEMLGSADILLVLLEAEAGLFSVPSKVLTYLCAGRPILSVMPEGNLAAKTIARVGAGENIDSGNKGRFVEVAIRLMADDDLRYTMGRKARQYAEEAFRGQSIADRFESVVRGAKGSGVGRANASTR
jgi:glycosyltransferase involved in cell wall biosynthesis